jgi:hypothetical protein
MHMTTSMSQRLNISCIILKIIEFFIITLFARLYAKVGIYSLVENSFMTALYY